MQISGFSASFEYVGKEACNILVVMRMIWARGKGQCQGDEEMSTLVKFVFESLTFDIAQIYSPIVC